MAKRKTAKKPERREDPKNAVELYERVSNATWYDVEAALKRCGMSREEAAIMLVGSSIEQKLDEIREAVLAIRQVVQDRA